MAKSILQSERISIHALLAESDRPRPVSNRQSADFYPRSPCGERRQHCRGGRSGMSISIHALLAESDPAEHPWWPGREFLSTLSLRRATLKGCRCTTIRTYFYPRSPCGERPGCPHRAHSPHRYFYPRSPCGERPLCISVLIMPHFISIHALLAESDGLAHCATVSAVQISIHALLAESDVSGLGRAARPGLFLSTLSLRRATLSNNSRRFVCLHFYPRSPCGERHPPSQSRYADTNFYPRSPCGERPYSGTNCSGANTYFYPRSPCGERLLLS